MTASELIDWQAGVLSVMGIFRQLRVMLQLPAIRRKLNRHGGQDGTLLGTLRDRRANAFGFLRDRTIH